jgi:hypothetical protein
MLQKIIVTKQMLQSKAEKMAHLSRELQNCATEYKELLDNYDPNCTEEIQGFETAPHSLCIKKCTECKKILSTSE